MHAVILAAGRGSRLGAMTDEVPKGMVELSGKPFLEWQYASIRTAGIKDVTVVTGYLGDVIERGGFSTIANPDWDRANMISSLACALENISGPLLISYSDIVYSTSSVRALLDSTAPLAITYDPKWLGLWQKRFEDPLSDAETFRLDTSSNLVEIGDRSDSLAEIEGQFMGLMKVEEEGRRWVEGLLQADPELRLSLDTTGLLNKLIASGKSIKAVPIAHPWCEIDSLSDLAVAEDLVKHGKLSFPGA